MVPNTAFVSREFMVWDEGPVHGRGPPLAPLREGHIVTEISPAAGAAASGPGPASSVPAPAPGAVGAPGGGGGPVPVTGPMPGFSYPGYGWPPAYVPPGGQTNGVATAAAAAAVGAAPPAAEQQQQQQPGSASEEASLSGVAAAAAVGAAAPHHGAALAGASVSYQQQAAAAAAAASYMSGYHVPYGHAPPYYAGAMASAHSRGPQQQQQQHAPSEPQQPGQQNHPGHSDNRAAPQPAQRHAAPHSTAAAGNLQQASSWQSQQQHPQPLQQQHLQSQQSPLQQQQPTQLQLQHGSPWEAPPSGDPPAQPGRQQDSGMAAGLHSPGAYSSGTAYPAQPLPAPFSGPAHHQWAVHAWQQQFGTTFSVLQQQYPWPAPGVAYTPWAPPAAPAAGHAADGSHMGQ